MAKSESPTPLEHVAPVYVDVAGTYVNVRQTHGERTLYTPEEARELAADLLAAAEKAEAEAEAGIRDETDVEADADASE